MMNKVSVPPSYRLKIRHKRREIIKKLISSPLKNSSTSKFSALPNLPSNISSTVIYDPEKNDKSLKKIKKKDEPLKGVCLIKL